MKKTLRDQEKNDALAGIDIKMAARLLGQLGGKAGRGDAKRRPSEVCRAAVNKRWDAYRKEKMSRRSIRAD
jgi:hypothetical protein